MKTIYYFTADWCQPCKKTRPIVEEMNREQSTAGFQIIDMCKRFPFGEFHTNLGEGTEILVRKKAILHL